MNDVLTAIAERFSCRSFTDKMPGEDCLNAITQAALQAPSGMNRQYWHVILVKNKEIMSEMQAEGMEFLSNMPDKTMYERMMSRGGKLFYNAPCMALVLIKEADPKGAELIDCGILCQNMVLAATSLGMASLHCGLAKLAFAGGKGQEFKKRLKFPEGYDLGLAVLLGYAKDITTPHEPNAEKITVVE